MSTPASAFLPLPTRFGDMLRILGPAAAETMVAVDPLVPVDEPLTVVRSFVAGVCDREGRLIVPLEIELVVDPATVVPDKQVPAHALLAAFSAAADIRRKLPAPPGAEWIGALFGEPARLGPLIMCRKTGRVFVARSPATGEPLHARDDLDRAPPPDDRLPADLITWDGPPGDHTPTMYAAAGGDTPAGPVASLEQMLLDQPQVVQNALRLQRDDPAAAAARGAADWCCQCPECQKPDPPDSDYKYALDRLVVLNAADVPVSLAPLGAWRLGEAVRIIGGLAPREAAQQDGASKAGDVEAAKPLADWRAAQAERMETCAPPRLLAGESDGRELLEIARLKLGLFVDVLAQLDAAWRATGRPHLCWNDETIRVQWREPGQAPAIAWGFQPLLRKVGLQPPAPQATPDGAPLVYPPAFTSPTLLAAEAQDAARYWDEPRPANIFVKSAKAGDKQSVTVLIEELGVAWALFCPADALHVRGKGWTAIVSPLPERDPNDGEGLPFAGYVEGTPLKVGEQYDACECRWYPRFGEAIDLHALGVLLLESLVSNDKLASETVRATLARERDELTKACRALPIEQREDYVKNWLSERCEADAPANIWTRRNLLHHHAARAGTRLDGLAPPLWQAAMSCVARLVTCIPGFSYCDDRTARAARIDGELLGLIELRGVLALLDDHLFGRTQPADMMRAALEADG